MRTFVAELRLGVMPPVSPVRRISADALVIDEDELATVSEVSDRVFVNTPISFRLDSPGGLLDVEAEDNWGAGLSGYDVRRLRAAGGTGRGVRVGIADSGLDATHPTFAAMADEGRITAFAAFAADGTKVTQHSGNGVLVPDTVAVPTFTHYHGTFCAALLAGADVDGKLRGIAPGIDLAVARVLQQFNNGTVASIYAGLEWLGDQGCDIVSLSLGWEGKHDEWAGPIRRLLDAGVVVVVAAGNSFGVPGVPPSDSPANYPLSEASPSPGLLLSVGALDPDDRVGDNSGGELADWSGATTIGPTGAPAPSEFATAAPVRVPSMVAAGVGVVSAAPGGRYRLETGTSMAAPHVAGLIAVALQLMREKVPMTTARTAAELVLSCVRPLASSETEPRAGRGKVDLEMLLRRLSVR